MQQKLNPKICENMELKPKNMQKYAVKFFYFIRMYDP